ncbi:MAG: metallophosphoesterase [Alphaproteobacteria bacterium]|uniref:Metallophosphoesterase n=1 Tax=Candidatus Nitrobium versatile TaxID=2884831 RepID=A0A953J3E4_9BACT|nr:metallophosphoesterase [Candidatus Nitrobium versatile]
MRLFLFVFFTLYGGLHVYAFIRARAAFAFGTGISLLLALFMAFMTAAPVLTRITEKQGYEKAAQILAYTGYTWMGVLFLFCSLSALIDLSRLLVAAGGYVLRKDLAGLYVPGRPAFLLSLSLSLLISLYGYLEAREIRMERIVLISPKIPEEAGTITIAQISDVHLGLIVREERLQRILALVKSANPDILVSTGDLVDGQIARLNGLAALLQEIRAPRGKFAVPGNHEYYAGIDQALAFTREAGFTILRGDAVTGVITLAGVDDPAAEAFGLFRDVPEKELLSALPREKFTVLLKHRPFVDRNAVGLFDLQLSGHTHKGQIFPFSLLTGAYYALKAGTIQAGYAELPGNSWLYVSRGAGTWGPPLRFLAPPEVTIIELVHGKRGAPLP